MNYNFEKSLKFLVNRLNDDTDDSLKMRYLCNFWEALDRKNYRSDLGTEYISDAIKRAKDSAADPRIARMLQLLVYYNNGMSSDDLPEYVNPPIKYEFPGYAVNAAPAERNFMVCDIIFKNIK